MEKNYADVLESYLIAEEGTRGFWKKFNYKGIYSAIQKEFVNRADGYKTLGPNYDRVMEEYKKASQSGNGVNAAEWNKKFNEAAIKDIIAKMKWKNIDIPDVVEYFEEKNWTTYKASDKKEKAKDPRYDLSFDEKEVARQCGFPTEKYRTDGLSNEQIWDAIEKELKIALKKVLACKEITNAFGYMVKVYNSTPKEELDDKFTFCYKGNPSKISLQWLRSQFAIDLFEGGGDDSDAIFEVCNGDQDFRIQIGRDIQEILGDYISGRFGVSVRYGDGDEGCLYIDL